MAIHSQGKEAAITGDLIHNPIQLADPGICANFDFDQKVGLATRQAFIDNHADRDVLILGTHFPTPAVGHIVRDGEGWGFTPVNADAKVNALVTLRLDDRTPPPSALSARMAISSNSWFTRFRFFKTESHEGFSDRRER